MRVNWEEKEDFQKTGKISLIKIQFDKLFGGSHRYLIVNTGNYYLDGRKQLLDCQLGL